MTSETHETAAEFHQRARNLPPLHPLIGDPYESSRCPKCGTPGIKTGVVGRLATFACPSCDPIWARAHARIHGTEAQQ